MLRKTESTKTYPQPTIIIPPDYIPYDPWDDPWTVVAEGNDPNQITQDLGNYFDPGDVVKLKMRWDRPLASWLPFGWGADYILAWITTNILKIAEAGGLIAWDGQFVDVLEDMVTVRLTIPTEYSAKGFGIAPAVFIPALLGIVLWLVGIFGSILGGLTIWKLYQAKPQEVETEIGKVAETARRTIEVVAEPFLKPLILPIVLIGGGWLVIKLLPKFFK